MWNLNFEWKNMKVVMKILFTFYFPNLGFRFSRLHFCFLSNVTHVTHPTQAADGSGPFRSSGLGQAYQAALQTPEQIHVILVLDLWNFPWFFVWFVRDGMGPVFLEDWWLVMIGDVFFFKYLGNPDLPRAGFTSTLRTCWLNQHFHYVGFHSFRV